MRFSCLAHLLVLLSTGAVADGIELQRPSAFSNLVSADTVERSSAAQYAQVISDAAAHGALAPASHPDAVRVRAIAQRMLPFAARVNPRAASWKWQVNYVGSKQINAWCMPGGKIVVYSGLLKGLALSDDELAVVLGHEISHALREHARARMGKSAAVGLGSALLGQVVGHGKYSGAFELGGNLLNLRFSRNDEVEADEVGLDLAARAGFNPRAGLSLWRKMAAASRGAPPEWLSTHPASSSRIADIERILPKVEPVYETALAQMSRGRAHASR